MKKGKVMKIVSATAIAASAFVAASPADAATVSQAEKLVKVAKDAGTVLKWAISIEGTADGKTRPWAQYNAAKGAYNQALDAVNTLPAALKTKYLADLEANVLLHINRTMHYIDAITAGEKIKVKQQALAYQLDRDLIDDETEKTYHELSKEIRKQAILLDRVYGKSTRDLIRAQYKQSAEKVRDSAIYAVTVKIELDLAAKAIAAKNTAQADKHIEEAKKYLKYVDNPVIKKTLTDRLNTIDTNLIPKVNKISAAEPKRIKVEFNRAMLAGYSTNAAENTSNYTVSGRSIKNVNLSDDKKTAVIELNEPLYTNSSYTLTVKKNIQTANYEALGNDDAVTTFTFSDSTKPTVSAIKSLTNGNIEIQFSELIDEDSALAISIDGKTVKSVTLSSDSDTVIIQKSALDGLGLRKGRSYSIVVSGAKDLVVYTPNTMNTYRSSFTYNPAADTISPIVKDIDVKDEKTITIEFSEPLASFSSSSHLVIKKGNSVIRPSSVKDVSSGKKTTFDVELLTSIYGTNETAVRLNVQVKDYKDVEGNSGKTTDQTVTLTKDTTPPRFVSAAYDKNAKEIQLSLSETLKSGTPSTSNVTVYNQKNELVTITLKANKDNKMIIDAKNLPDGVYTINVASGAVKDQSISQNNNTAFATTVTKKEDTDKPTVSFLSSGENGVFIAVFSEAMAEETVINPANYTVGGKTLTGETTFNVSSDKKVVTIKLPEGMITTSGNQTITANNIKDLSDNTMNNYSANVNLNENTKPVLTSALIDRGNYIKLTFSENIELPDSGQGNFVITINDQEPLTASQYTVGKTSSSKELILTPNEDGLFTSGKIVIQTTDKTTIRDSAGNTLASGTVKEIN
jgi:trimeric autotransporter adhesin